MGLMRSESALAEDAVSRGARGLMQAPRTARQAQRHGLSYTDADQLLQAEDNIRFGTVYLRDLLTAMGATPCWRPAPTTPAPTRSTLAGRAAFRRAPSGGTLPCFETRDYIRGCWRSPPFTIGAQQPVSRVCPACPHDSAPAAVPCDIETAEIVTLHLVEKRHAAGPRAASRSDQCASCCQLLLSHHLLPRLAAAGHDCLALSRYRMAVRELSIIPGVEVRQTDVYDPEKLAACLHGADAIINMVGILNEPGRKGKGFHRAHVDLVERVIAACRAAGVRRFVQVSALNAARAGVTTWSASEAEARTALPATSGARSCSPP
jgi:hypothetical protein